MNIKRILTTIALTISLAVHAQTENLCYGFAPRTLAPEDIAAHGTAMNNFIECAICLNPSADPLLASLKGSKVVGVRCFLRADYKQKAKRWSAVWTRTGSLTTEIHAQYENLTEGWNEVYFTEPVTIGDEPLYVGYQVFELKGTPYPAVTYAKASVNDGCYINMAQEGFQKYENRGTLLIEAIIEPADATTEGTAFTQASDWPMAVAPGSHFDCTLYIRSQRSEPIQSVEVTTTADDGATVRHYTVTFDSPIPAFDGALIPYSLDAPQTEGESVEMSLAVTAINGTPCTAGKVNTVHLYVSEDAFVRNPLVEEFTGQTCVNCPFMVYYLDQAIEDFGESLVYVTHHAGFQNDKLTMGEDQALLYLFGGGMTYNPAAMFDRRVLKGETLPVISAKEASADPYKLYIEEAMTFPAKAGVEVEVSEEDGQLTCHVTGKIAKAMLDADNLRLTAYLVEDDIKPVGNYVQLGVSSQVADDAPADMVEKFRHNGLIRIAFTGKCGDALTTDADGRFDATFTKGYIRPMGAATDTYQDALLNKEWVKNNLRAVAFVHKYNTDALGIEDNFVLNAAQRRLVAEEDIVSSVTPDDRPAQAYDLQGRPATAQSRGIVILSNGQKVVR